MANHPAEKSTSPLYLGLDFSTQQLKAVSIDNKLKITHESCVEFDTDFPEFKTVGGVNKHKDGLSVTAPTLMWIKALDLLLMNMKSSGYPFSRVAGVSGSGQQHGSVYWRRGSESILKSLSPSKTLSEQLESCFSVSDSPVWMDSSTTSQCRELEIAVGGAGILAKRTGSRAYERFTGNQIAKISQTTSHESGLSDTERISLVSSFGATLFLGKYAEIDYSDGSGMNLMDITTKEWWQDALNVCGPDLRNKLGSPVPTNTILGPISTYYAEEYGFPYDCSVVAFTGDNPASLAGMRLEHGDVVISLGTSDTLFLWIDEAHPQLMGHVFVNPVDKDAYMALLCYKNGSRTREVIRDKCAGRKWDEFDRLLDKTPPGNHGNIGIYFTDPEITPSGQGEFRFCADDAPVDSFPPEVEVRAILEGQLMAKLFHAQSLGYKITSSSRILATGGGSQNTRICQMIADIFGANVFTLTETTNSASLGAAYIAKRAVMGKSGDPIPFHRAVDGATSYKLVNSPTPGVTDIYTSLTQRYKHLEQNIAC